MRCGARLGREVHPQYYFGVGGPPHRWLTAIAEHLPLSFHSVGLSIGSAAGVDLAELEALAALCDRCRPAMVSDHLSWSNGPNDKFPDLLPIPYMHSALDHFVAEVGRVQDRLGRTIPIENPSRYLAFAQSDWDEVDFLHMLCRRSGCGLLLDINNVEVSAFNLCFDPIAWLDAFDPGLVGEVHLAGHAVKDDDMGGMIAIDDHGSPVRSSCWKLLAKFLARGGSKPVLVEWDTDVPDYATLMAEAMSTDALLLSKVTFA